MFCIQGLRLDIQKNVLPACMQFVSAIGDSISSNMKDVSFAASSFAGKSPQSYDIDGALFPLIFDLLMMMLRFEFLRFCRSLFELAKNQVISNTRFRGAPFPRQHS